MHVYCIKIKQITEIFNENLFFSFFFAVICKKGH